MHREINKTNIKLNSFRFYLVCFSLVLLLLFLLLKDRVYRYNLKIVYYLNRIVNKELYILHILYILLFAHICSVLFSKIIIIIKYLFTITYLRDWVIQFFKFHKISENLFIIYQNFSKSVKLIYDILGGITNNLNLGLV